ncbi:hypothetical protein, partial [Jatrophihabitans endophyticus]|uniref:hypothetical protein n=1 Tax=Jatrophihabitans endophyticus TaxID=1206085 RepID=UPI001A0B17FE
MTAIPRLTAALVTTAALLTAASVIAPPAASAVGTGDILVVASGGTVLDQTSCTLTNTGDSSMTVNAGSVTNCLNGPSNSATLHAKNGGITFTAAVGGGAGPTNGAG